MRIRVRQLVFLINWDILDVFGGKFVPETIMPALDQLEKAYLEAKTILLFNTELEYYLESMWDVRQPYIMLKD